MIKTKWENKTYLESEIKKLEEVDYSSLEEDKLNFMQAGHVGALTALSDAYKERTRVQLFLGILSGLWIGIAYTAAIYGAEKMTNPSAQKLIIGSIFPLVILMIFFVGGHFFTAYTYSFSSVIRGMIRWKEICWAWTIMYFGNILGCLLFIVIFHLSGAYHFDSAHTTLTWNLGLSKLYYLKDDVNYSLTSGMSAFDNVSAKNVVKTIIVTFFSAILCNALVSNTVISFRGTKGNVVGTIILFWTIIFLFVTSGYQHCVANWHIVWAVIVTGWFNDSVTTSSGTFNAQASVGYLLIVFSIIPSFFGNLVGCLMVGELHHYAYGKISVLTIQKIKLKNLKYNLDKINSKNAKS